MTQLADDDVSTTTEQPAPATNGQRRGEPDVRRSTDVYRLLWRWHFYAGLLAAPVLLVAAITGAALVFADELRPVVYSQRYAAASSPADGPARGLSDRVDAARQAVAADRPDARVTFVHVGEWTDSVTSVAFNAGGPEQDDAVEVEVAVDPRTLAVQATVTGDGPHDVFELALDLHRTLLVGETGRVVVELATGWGILLLITGVYLWWPRGGKSRVGTWVPRVRGGPAYRVLRDWHAVVGAYATVPLALIMLTGLMFSAATGRGWHWYLDRTRAMPPEFTSPPKSVVPADAPTGAAADALALDVLDRELAARGLQDEPMYVVPPQAADDCVHAFVSRFSSAGPVQFQAVWLDRYTGAVLAEADTRTAHPAMTAMCYGYGIHTGAVYGTPTKVLALVACLALAGACVTGAVMWWVRRPTGTLGLPRRPDRAMPRPMALTMATLGVLIPTFGGSLILILLGDRLVDRVWRSRLSRA